jgi:hypothetical protein
MPDGTLDARVRAPALDGRANASLVRLIAGTLGLRPRQVHIARGLTGRTKLVELDIESVEALTAALSNGR